MKISQLKVNAWQDIKNCLLSGTKDRQFFFFHTKSASKGLKYGISKLNEMSEYTIHGEFLCFTINLVRVVWLQFNYI